MSRKKRRQGVGHLWQEAAALAARRHRFQLRKDGKTPYYSHVVRVAMTVRHVFGCEDEVVLCAALLHDLIEDTTTDYEDIEDRFGREVAECVAALTKNMALPEKEREREYDERMERAGWRVAMVKLADAYDNLCDVETYPASERAEGVRKAIERCGRAVALARAHVREHPALGPAAGRVAKLAAEHPLRRGGRGKKV